MFVCCAVHYGWWRFPADLDFSWDARFTSVCVSVNVSEIQRERERKRESREIMNISAVNPTFSKPNYFMNIFMHSPSPIPKYTHIKIEGCSSLLKHSLLPDIAHKVIKVFNYILKDWKANKRMYLIALELLFILCYINIKLKIELGNFKASSFGLFLNLNIEFEVKQSLNLVNSCSFFLLWILSLSLWFTLT